MLKTFCVDFETTFLKICLILLKKNYDGQSVCNLRKITFTMDGVTPKESITGIKCLGKENHTLIKRFTNNSAVKITKLFYRFIIHKRLIGKHLLVCN